jgi:hypothetical protein
MICKIYEQFSAVIGFQFPACHFKPIAMAARRPTEKDNFHNLFLMLTKNSSFVLLDEEP